MGALDRFRRDLEHDRRGLRLATWDTPPAQVTSEEAARSRAFEERCPEVTWGTVGGRHEGYLRLRKVGYTAIEETRGEVLDKLEAFVAEFGP